MRLTRPLLTDSSIAVVFTAVGLVSTPFLDLASQDDRPVNIYAYLLVAVAGLAVAVRRRFPEATLAVVSVSTTAYLTVGFPYGPIFASFALAVYTVARHRLLARSVPYAAGSLVLLLVHVFFNEAALPVPYSLGPAAAWVVVPFAIGVTVRLTREATERERAEAVRRSVDDERLRIVQEVHDVVGHGLAAIKMQADVALHVLGKKPEQAEIALGTISRTSSEALEELRATLAVIKRSEDEDARSPTPGLAKLGELRRRLESVGIDVRMETTGDPHPLPPVVDLTGYRVVQESLTNVLKHSDAKHATVSVRYEPDAVALVVSNPMVGEPGPGSGLGIPGMRERVTSVGGTFSAGRTPDGEFEVRACLPTGGTT